MTALDFLIFGVYMCGVLGIGYYHFRRNRNAEDYYVGGRSVKAHHVGLSIVATDVGGGFSIGLGGLGFVMGLSGSWLLFTGLVGAWLSAVLIIPRVKRVDRRHAMMTYPDFLRWRYDDRVALAAALISGLGYLGFTGAQILAGAKLASATLFTAPPFGLDPLLFSLYTIAAITVLYTVIGGLKAVIYTDTAQWMILLCGLTFVTVPVTLHKVGGFEALRRELPPEFFSLTNLDAATFVNWMVTIIPIWLIGMTLYQRMFACGSEREARRAWYIAGVFEYPVMAFLGVFLGMCARVVFPAADAEMAMPMLIKEVLPVGVTGIVIASYFSAIMSTADSCLMASSGNLVNDVMQRHVAKGLSERGLMRLSQAATLAIGALAVVLASHFEMVLDAILYAYAFMVSGLFVPTLGAFFWKRSSAAGALAGMIAGGGATLVMLLGGWAMPLGLDACFYGICISAGAFVGLSLLMPSRAAAADTPAGPEAAMDIVEPLDGAVIQHGLLSRRIHVMKLGGADVGALAPRLDALARERGYSKIFAKAPASARKAFASAGYRVEAVTPGLFGGAEDGVFLAKYPSPERAREPRPDTVAAVLEAARGKEPVDPDGLELDAGFTLCAAGPADAAEAAAVYRAVFETYPFPIHDPEYLRRTMDENIAYFGVRDGARLVSMASAEMDVTSLNVEMTDFATLPEYRGHGFALCLLHRMEEEMRRRGMKTFYTIARALSFGMNITFAKLGYAYAGTLVNNTNICGRLESMNVWHKPAGPRVPESP